MTQVQVEMDPLIGKTSVAVQMWLSLNALQHVGVGMSVVMPLALSPFGRVGSFPTARNVPCHLSRLLSSRRPHVERAYSCFNVGKLWEIGSLHPHPTRFLPPVAVTSAQRSCSSAVLGTQGRKEAKDETLCNKLVPRRYTSKKPSRTQYCCDRQRKQRYPAEVAS